MGKTASPLPQLRGPQHDPTGQDALISPVGGSELPQRRSARPQSRARCGRRRDRCRGVRRAPITVGLRRRTAVLNGRLRRRSGVRQLGRGRTVLDPHAPCVPIFKVHFTICQPRSIRLVMGNSSASFSVIAF